MASMQHFETLEMQAKKLVGDEPVHLINLLYDLSSSDNTVRSNAESVYNCCKREYPYSLSIGLAYLLRGSTLPETRTMSALLLRQLLTRFRWPQIQSQIQDTLKSICIECLETETSPEVSKNLCNLVSDIAKNLLPRFEWSELQSFMLTSLSSGLSHVRESGLLLFIELIPHYAEMFSPHVDTIHAAFVSFMEQSLEDLPLGVGAVKASVKLVLHFPNSSNHEKFQDLLDCVFRTMSKIVLEKVYEMYAQKVLEEMIELAGMKTGFLRQRVETLVDFMILVAEQDQVFEEKTRHLAVEFIITVAEDREQGCLMIQKLPQSINKLLGLFMNMLLFIEDDPSWREASSDDNNAGETDMYCYGMGCLGRFAVALRGNAISSNFPDLFPSFLDDSEWTKRHAGVTALGLIAEGCSKVIKQYSLSLFVEKVLLLFQDSHPRVRWAAINAIGHFSKHLGPQLQEKFHQWLIPALLSAMDDFQNPRVQAHATSTMLLFSQSCTSNILKPYLKGILRKLLDLLQKEKRMLKDGALTTLASMANSSMEYFREYYNNVMPYLKVIWESGLDISNDHILVAKSMECVTMIGMAVGKEMFGSDAEQVVNMLILLQKHDSEPGDPMRIHLLQAWSRLCKCLGQEFLPYLSVSMPYLLQSAQLKSYRLIANPENNDESDDESMEEVAFGSGGFGIKINVLDEKALACNVLCCYAAELKGALHLWIDEVAKTLVPLLKFSFHDKVRTAAVSAMPLILHSVIAAMNRGLYLPGFKESPIKILSRTIIQALVEALHEESRTKIRTRILDSLNKCMQISGSLLEKSQLTNFTDVIIEVLTACSFKITEREKRVKEEDVDAALELLEEEIIEEEKAFNIIEDCLGTLIKTSKASFLTLSNNLFPCLKLMWGNDRTLKERTIALRVLYDVAEQCREEAFRYYETCLPFLNKACNDENPEVRQVVARGISICAEFGGSVFKPHVDEALSNLKAVMEHPNALQPDNIMTYEVAVSAFGQICRLHCDSIGSYEVVSFWLSHLPLRNNLNEAKLVHDQLCSMIETSEENIFGPGDVNLPKIIAVLSEVLWAGDNLATAQTIYRMIKLLKQFQQKLQPSTLASLPLHHQNLIESIL